MPTWVITLAFELIKMLYPIINKILKDEKPNKEASRELLTKLRGVIGEAPELKNI